jgi:nucleoid-associated protein YgaU
MTERKDILDGAAVTPSTKYGLIYTCRCGWIDVGHAYPQSADPTQGAANLWNNIRNEFGRRSKNGLWYRVPLNMLMGTNVLKQKIRKGINKDFAVRLGLSLSEKQAVALAIFMGVSVDFEKYQSEWGLSSSFSAEDLPSNLIGFYHALFPGTNYFNLCEPVSKSAAEHIWDTYGGPGREIHKVRALNASGLPQVVLFTCSECQGGPGRRRLAELPAFLQKIKPSRPNLNHFRLWREEDPELTGFPSTRATEHPVATSYLEMVVKPGDTLSGVSKKEYGDYDIWPLIWDLNRDASGSDPNRLQLGTKLRIAPKTSYTLSQIEDAKRRSRNIVTVPPRR